MGLLQLDTENADRNITALVTVLTHTPTVNGMCVGLIKLGDGTKNLSATGGVFQLVITVGGQTVQPSPQYVTFSTAVRSMVWTNPFPVIANDEVIMRVLSPNAADSDVDCTAYLYDMTAALPGAVPDAAGGLPISDAGGLDLDNDVANKLAAIKLDHLIAVADADDVVDNSIIAKMASKAATANWSDFNNTTDSQEAIRDRGDSAWITATSVTVSDKTGFSLSATGADLILKSSTFIQAIVAAINEFATYGLTAINTLLVTTGIKTATTAAPTDMALNSTVAKSATALSTATWTSARAVKLDTLGGAGAITWTYTLTDVTSLLAIADADVWVTTDSAGTNIIATGKTNQSGVVTFYLDAGTVYVWRQKSGYNFDNPDTEIVS